ncbi:MAG: mercury(II) reductase, partial [Sulfobacillus benefaciens]
PDLATLVKEKDQLVATLRQKKYQDLLPEYDITLIPGEAHFVDKERLAVADRILTADRYLIATGARPRIPGISGLESVDYLTSTSALNLTNRPDHLIIIGSGYIALELGQLFRHWGSQVTLMQRGPELMPGYDPEVREVVRAMLMDDGIEVMTGVTYQRVEQVGSDKIVYLTVNGTSCVVSGDALLIAAGREPNTEELQLDVAGVQRDSQGAPQVDAALRTTNPRIYAAGDVTMGPQFVYVAAYEGKLAARNALGVHKPAQSIDLSVVPMVTFTHPAIASVGLTEEAANRRGLRVKWSVLSLEAVARALANRETQGVFKMVADKDTGRILGVQVVAENAGDVIYAAQLSVKFGLTIEDLNDTLAPYLTMAEGLKLTALTFDQDVAKLSCCAG